jgi:hypothetical protein
MDPMGSVPALEAAGQSDATRTAAMTDHRVRAIEFIFFCLPVPECSGYMGTICS